MATSDEISRTEAPTFDFEMKFYVGGPYALANLHAITAGSGYTATVSTTTTADVDEDSTTIPVVSTSGFTTGFVVIHPEDTGELYEVIGYGGTTSTTFTNLTRYTDDVDLLRHASGATVSEWVDITSFVTGVPTLSISGKDEVVQWEPEIQGVRFNSNLLANDRSLLAMWRFRPKDGDLSTWTDWEVAFCGYVVELSGEDSYKQEKKWSAKVASLEAYVSNTDVPAQEYGRVNLADGASVEVSSTIYDPTQEWGTGEFNGIPDLSGDSLVDEDMFTLWL